MSSQDFGIRTAQAIRPPSTANLMIDSADRNQTQYTNPFNFQIQKPQALLNGYFTRIGVSEVVMEWCEPNIPESSFTIDCSGTHVIDLSGGFYTVSGLLNTIKDKVNAAVPSALSLSGDAYTPIFILATQPIEFDTSYVTSALGIATGQQQTRYEITCPDLRLYRYIDIVCEDLTSVQRVKDSATTPYPHDVLTRWYCSEDGEETYDELGFPILMGYKQYSRRRLFNPPKQIRWEQNLPVGNLRFVAYGRTVGNLYVSVETGSDTNWEMTLQLSEN